MQGAFLGLTDFVGHAAAKVKMTPMEIGYVLREQYGSLFMLFFDGTAKLSEVQFL